MRADMFKIIVERPRSGGAYATAVKLKRDSDQDRKFIGLKRHARLAGLTKSLNENLAPLVRFIQRRVGRRWDDVFSEICAGLDTGSTVKMHVREHLDDFVLFGISRGRQGNLLHRGFELRPDCHNCCWPEFYVDPADGVLKDRIWFWRDQGETAPRTKNELRWNGLPR